MSDIKLTGITAATPLTAHLITCLNNCHLLNCLSFRCNVHNTALELTHTDKVKDGWHMVCHQCRDGKQQSIRKHSWFSNRHHSIPSCIHAINLMAARSKTSYIVDVTGISRESVYAISADLSTRMARFNEQHKPHWGGEDVVEIDECHMKWKVDRKKGKCIEECKVGEGDWLIGLIERRSGTCWIQPIPNRTKRSMLPIIHSLVDPGTRIMTDAHETYNLLDHDYKHEVINKAQEGFSRYGRTRSTSINVNMCEGMWKHLREFSHAKSYSSVVSVHRIVHEYLFSKFQVSVFELIKIEG